MNKRFNGIDVIHSDAETGEILCETKGCTQVKDNEMTEKEIEKKKYLDSHIMKFKDGDIFVKFYLEAIPVLRKHLTPSEFVFAVSIAEFVSWQDCVLRKGTHGNNHIIDMKELSELLDMDYGVVRRLVSALKKKGVIGKHETGTILEDSDSKAKVVYTVNPYIYFRGVDVNKTVASFYENTGWDNL